MDIKENINLSDFSTFKTGGVAKYFSIIESLVDLKQVVGFARRNQLPIFILGGGSNLLISDDGVDGVILKMEIKGVILSSSLGRCAKTPSSSLGRCAKTPSSSLRGFFERNFSTAQLVELLKSFAQKICGNPASLEIVQVVASAGENWDDLVKQTVEKGLCGLENLSYIPGTVGASVVQNIGAYGVEIKDIVEWVEVFDTSTQKIKKLTGTACKFGYRDSIFKKEEGGNLIVIRVAYNLIKNGELKKDYKDIQNYLSKNNIQSPTLGQLRDIIIDIRKNKLPDCKEVGTAGSFFKNPIISKEKLECLLEKYSELPHYSSEGEFKISLAYVLDKILGLKGLREGSVGLYENQSLVLVNYGGATSEDILNFVKKIKQEVKDEIGIDIYPEVVMWQKC